jgi:hypothetical protein
MGRDKYGMYYKWKLFKQSKCVNKNVFRVEKKQILIIFNNIEETPEEAGLNAAEKLIQNIKHGGCVDE